MNNASFENTLFESLPEKSYYLRFQGSLDKNRIGITDKTFVFKNFLSINLKDMFNEIKSFHIKSSYRSTNENGFEYEDTDSLLLNSTITIGENSYSDKSKKLIERKNDNLKPFQLLFILENDCTALIYINKENVILTYEEVLIKKLTNGN